MSSADLPQICGVWSGENIFVLQISTAVHNSCLKSRLEVVRGTRARPDAGSRAFHATSPNDYRDKSYMTSAKNLGIWTPLVTVPLTKAISTIVGF